MENNSRDRNTLQKAAPLLVAAAAVLWGILVIFVRKLNAAGLEAMEIVGIRVYGSAFFLFAGIWLFQKVRYGKEDRQSARKGMEGKEPDREITQEETGWASLLRIKWPDAWCFLGTGVVSIVFFSYCYFRNVEVSSVAVSSILMYTSPVWVMLLSAVCFREKLNGRKSVALFLALAGCILVSGIAGGSGGAGMQSVNLQGILLGIGSGIGYGLYSIFGRFALNKGYHPMTVSAYTFLFACVGVLPFIDIVSVARKLIGEPECIVWAVCISLLSTCMSFTLYTMGLRYLEAGRAAVLATLEPIVSTAVGVIYYQEPLTGMMMLGIVMVLGASILISRK